MELRALNNRLRQAFTLIEIISTIVIVAILVLSAIIFVPSFISWAQQTADQRTLLVLNDALTRYKCEGGSLTALTQGAPAGDVIAALEQPISWAGATHQVMQTAVTYPARSLDATGSGTSYQFTRYNHYTNSNAPSISHGVQSFTTVGTTTWTVPYGIHSVEVLVVAGGGGGASGGGGGGGGGGVVHQLSYAVTPGASISVTVGTGGAACNSSISIYNGTQGGNSSFGGISATGGGYGGGNGSAGGSGGSGGGSYACGQAGGSGISGQGYNGGAGGNGGCGWGGAGGGAGGVGHSNSANNDEAGGLGLQVTIGGNTAFYASGGSANQGATSPGGGGAWGRDATPNTGGGGGGGYYEWDGSAGGSGIVIVSY